MRQRPSTRSRRGNKHEAPEQLPLVIPPRAPAGRGREPEQAAKLAIARRGRASAVPGHVKLVLTLDVPRALAERLSARAIHEGKNLEALVIELLDSATR